MSADIKEGRGLFFDESDLDRLRELIKFVESGSKGVWGALFRFFLPAIIFLGILWLLIFILGR